MRDVICNAYARFDKGMHEPGLNLEIQVFHWKEEMKLLENDIKNARIGVTDAEIRHDEQEHMDLGFLGLRRKTTSQI